MIMSKIFRAQRFLSKNVPLLVVFAWFFLAHMPVVGAIVDPGELPPFDIPIKKPGDPSDTIVEKVMRDYRPGLDNNMVSMALTIKGDINPGDEIKVGKQLNRLRKNADLKVFITSNGGDVQASIRIGRLLRQYEAKIITGSCMSSCVLVLLGGVERTVFTDQKRGRGVGLHRPYFGVLNPNMTTAEITKLRNQLKAEIAAYIKEMNGSDRLLDMMEAIPPEKIKILTEAEITDLGLSGRDPVWDEKRVGMEAAIYGISSYEFRKRLAEGESKCQKFDGYMDPKTNQFVPGNAYERDDCLEATYWALPVSVYRIRNNRYKNWVQTFTAEGERTADGTLTPALVAVARKCRIQFMTLSVEKCGRD